MSTVEEAEFSNGRANVMAMTIENIDVIFYPKSIVKCSTSIVLKIYFETRQILSTLGTLSENFVGNDVGTIHEKSEMVSKNSDGG